MATSDTEAKRLASSEYWDERYAEVGPDEQVHEWFRSFKELEPFLAGHLFQVRPPEIMPKILHLGSGDSTIPQDLANRGYKDQLCIDFSPVVVDVMSKRHANIEGIVWQIGDVRQMNDIEPESIDIAFDKGTLDAMIHGSPWSPPEDVVENTSRYIQEVYRILKADGQFLYVTYRQPHFIKPLLSCKGTEWDIDVSILGGSDSSFDYHAFVLKKATPQATGAADPVGNRAIPD